jgi:ATP-binding cassette subfamily C protein
MCGVLSPTEGEVLLGGVPLHDCSAESLAAKLGVVVGPPVVKHGTVRENLRLRLPDASDDAAFDAAEMACLAEVVARLPGGYEATLDTKASSLSGGERQRLGVAQALVGRPELLLLDEATCHLDPSTENRLIENVCSAGTTLVSVAHRPAFVQASDAVYRVQHGRVVREASQFSLERAPLPECRTVEANFTA